MSTIPRQLGALLDVLGLEWSSLFDENKRDAGENRERVVTFLYRILDTLDNKTGHILRFTALLLAAHTFLASVLIGNKQTPHWILFVVLVLLLFPLGTGVLALWVFRVSWNFFGLVRETEEKIGTDDQIGKELQELAKICDTRVNFNQWSFVMCCCSVAAFLATLVLAFVVVIEYGVQRY